MKWVLLGVVVLLVALFVVGRVWPTDGANTDGVSEKLTSLMSKPVTPSRLGAGCKPFVLSCGIGKGDGYQRASLTGTPQCNKKKVRFTPNDGGTAYDVRIGKEKSDIFIPSEGATLTLLAPVKDCRILINSASSP